MTGHYCSDTAKNVTWLRFELDAVRNGSRVHIATASNIYLWLAAPMCGNEPRAIPAHARLERYLTQGHIMKTKLAMTCVIFGALLGSAAAIAGDDAKQVGT